MCIYVVQIVKVYKGENKIIDYRECETEEKAKELAQISEDLLKAFAKKRCNVDDEIVDQIVKVEIIEK